MNSSEPDFMFKDCLVHGLISFYYNNLYLIDANKSRQLTQTTGNRTKTSALLYAVNMWPILQNYISQTEYSNMDVSLNTDFIVAAFET